MTGTLHELEANISANLGVCNASKVAFIHVTKQLPLELRPGTRVNGVALAVVGTRLAGSVRLRRLARFW